MRLNFKLVSLVLACFLSSASALADERPNILIITADDMGFADTGAFGSEIQTPNIYDMAFDGIRFNQYYTNALCTVTRTALMAGVDPHRAGAGNMRHFLAPNQDGQPGYEGFLRDEFKTLGDIMQDAGYATFVTGKWDLGRFPHQIPRARGFDRDFVMLDDHGSHYTMMNIYADNTTLQFTEDGNYLTRLPKDYYSSRTYTDKMISYIDENQDSDKPFFAFLSYQAPHDPFHVDEPWRSMYEGQYDVGMAAIRVARFEKQKELGIIPEDTILAERYWYVPDSRIVAPIVRAVQGREMELYAGLLTNMDYHLGRIIQHLKDIGEYDNTIILFFGDNGPEGNETFKAIAQFGTSNYIHKARNWSANHDIRAQGSAESYAELSPGWAQVGAVPFYGHKMLSSEGGIRSSLIIKPVAESKHTRGAVRSDFMHVSDIYMTLVEMTGQEFENGYTNARSWYSMLMDPSQTVRTSEDWLGWETSGSRALRKGDWKILNNPRPYGTEEWQLYNVVEDWAERNDLADAHPEIVEELASIYENEYMVKNGVIHGDRGWFESLWWNSPLRFEDGYNEGQEVPKGMYPLQFTPPANMMADPKE